MRKRFVILATPRCGSNWLCSLLDSHPDILCHHELFNLERIRFSRSLNLDEDFLGGMQQRQEAPLEFLAQAWKASFGYKAVGFKINLGQSEIIFNEVLDDPDIAKIIISRRNRVKSYVSEAIAEKTKVWESFPESTPMVDPGPINVDAAELVSQVQRNLDYYSDLRQRLHATGQKVLEMEYEMLGERAQHQKMLNFLGQNPDAFLTTKTSKMNRASLRALISNFDRLAFELQGSDLLDDLTSGETQ